MFIYFYVTKYAQKSVYIYSKILQEYRNWPAR